MNFVSTELILIFLSIIIVYIISYKSKNSNLIKNFIFCLLGIYIVDFILFNLYGYRIEFFGKIIILIISIILNFTINRVKESKDN